MLNFGLRFPVSVHNKIAKVLVPHPYVRIKYVAAKYIDSLYD